MTREELKNKISMALKDPILQQGFEIICKNLAELEKENAELKTENNKLLDVINNQDVKIVELEQKVEQTEKDLEDYQFNYPTIKELEKENAELRNNGFTVSAMTEQQLKVAIEKGEQLETRCTELFLQNNEFAERFEKATEIIKGLLSCCRNYPQENAEKMKQAEQFLKEIEK